MELLRLTCTLSLIAVTLCNEYTQVLNTTDGLVKGVVIQTPVGKTVRAYLGIPYCEPPIGNLRFKSPSPLLERWPHVLVADKYSKSCIQGIDPKNRHPDQWWVPNDEDTSEDCLTLNIWAPMDVKDAAVMVWIHGGGFEGGTSSSYKYDGQLLAALGDVIVVSMNHRLNIFGYLYMGDEYAGEVPGNVGLMDQYQALQWVRKNIKQFGGDPNKVAIFGESTGGASVNFHLTIPYKTRPFKRAIIQSGTSNAFWAYMDNKTATEFSEKILEENGCSKEPAERVRCLRSLDVKDLVQSTFNVNSTLSNGIKWTPVIDGSFITAEPETVFKSGKVDKDIEVMIGTTREEGSVYALGRGALQLREDSFVDQKTFRETIKGFMDTNNDFLVELVQHVYTNWEHPSDPVLMRQELIHFITDFFFHCKTNSMSDLLESNGNRVYRFQFSHHPSDSTFPKWSGASHADELSFVFGLPNDVTRNFTRHEKYLSSKMIGYWSNLAKYGTPNVPQCQKEWPEYKEKNRYYMDLGLPLTIKTGRNLRYPECSLWNNLLPKIMDTMSVN